MPATNGNRTPRNNTMTAMTAASIAIQKMTGRLRFIIVHCERNNLPMSKSNAYLIGFWATGISRQNSNNGSSVIYEVVAKRTW